jgi:death on curing protein
MNAPRWVSKKALLLLHAQSLARFGGSAGMRDEGLFDSALARPQNLYAYKNDCTLAEMAAALGVGLAKNHPFVDGNKRIAFLAVGVFLSVNGKSLDADQLEAISIMLGIADGTVTEVAFAAWIAAHI